MRFLVIGAGAIGGVVGGRLHQSGAEVVLVARGEHGRAMRQRGLTLEAPGERAVLSIPVLDRVADHHWAGGGDQGGDPGGTVVLLAVKSQDTEGVLGELAAAAPPGVPVVCLQNGVENERRVRRRFERTYGICVMSPTTHLHPGVVQAHSSPTTGLLDIGCYPSGVDETAGAIAAALSAATFESRPQPEIMRWKYRKLIMNLANAIEALCGPEGRGSELARMVAAEGEAVMTAAGIDVASRSEDAERRDDRLSMRPTETSSWSGGSSWQSLARGTGSVESDFLNGEIVLLGGLHGVPTPANALLQRLAREAASGGAGAGQRSPDELMALVG